MTNEEIEKLSKRLYDGLDMLTEKAGQISEKKAEWSLEQLGAMADIEKDMAKTLKSITQTQKILCETSIEKY